MASKESYTKACKLFESFHERAPRKGEIAVLTLPDGSQDWCLAIGPLDAVMYSTAGESKPYFHRHTKSDRPLLCVSSDGKQMIVVRGRYRFTDRGFLG